MKSIVSADALLRIVFFFILCRHWRIKMNKIYWFYVQEKAETVQKTTKTV